MEIILNSDNFENEVIKSDKPVIVDFWATWCGPCRMIAPIIEEISNEKSIDVKVCKLNVDEQPDIAIKNNVEAIPTIICFKNGQEHNRLIGLSEKQEILDLLK